MTTNMNIERNKELSEVMAMMAEVTKKFKTFAKDFNDEDIDEMCHKVSSAMNTAIVELTALDSYLYTTDVVNWTEGVDVSAIAMAKVG